MTLVTPELERALRKCETAAKECALPGFVDSKNEEKTERNAGYQMCIRDRYRMGIGQAG